MIRRRLFTVLAAGSLLLWLGTVALWARSYRVGETWSYSSGQVIGYWDERQRWALGRSYHVGSEAGRIDLIVDTDWPRPPKYFKHSSTSALMRGAATRDWRFAGFVVAAYSGTPPLSSYLPQPGDGFGPLTLRREWGAPDWFLVLLFAALPAAWVVKRIRASHRNRPDHCTSCGYNLTGNVSGVCPECGTPTLH